IIVSYMPTEDVIEEPLPEFRAAALDVAAANVVWDLDGAIRRVPLVVRVKGFEMPGFAISIATNYAGSPLTKGGPDRYRIGPTAIHGLPLSGRNHFPSVFVSDWSVPVLRIQMADVLEPG